MTTQADKATPTSYKEARRKLMIAADRLTCQMAAAADAANDAMMARSTASEAERQRKLVIEMIADCSYVIEWLESGCMPGHRRGIERRAGYQREVPTDPALLGAVISAEGCDRYPATDEPRPAPRLALERALRGLTDRERECFRLSQAESFALTEVAEMLGISKSSVGTYLLRARRKIDTNLRAGEDSSVG